MWPTTAKKSTKAPASPTISFSKLTDQFSFFTFIFCFKNRAIIKSDEHKRFLQNSFLEAQAKFAKVEGTEPSQLVGLSPNLCYTICKVLIFQSILATDVFEKGL